MNDAPGQHEFPVREHSTEMCVIAETYLSVKSNNTDDYLVIL